MHRNQVERDADRRGAVRPEHVGGEAMREEEVVRGGERVRLAPTAGRVLSLSVPEPCGDPGLVVRDPPGDAIRQARRDGVGVLHERVDDLALRPSSAILERLRQVPVVESDVGVDPVREELVDQPVVVVEAGGVHATPTLREDSRPRDREAVCVEAELAHQPDVLAVAVVRVARDATVVSVHDRARLRREAVPDALAATVLRRRTLDLVRSGGSPPGEGRREDARRSVGYGRHRLLNR